MEVLSRGVLAEVKVYTFLQKIYWLNYWHILVSKGMSGFKSNTLLIPQEDLFYRFNKNNERKGDNEI